MRQKVLQRLVIRKVKDQMEFMFNQNWVWKIMLTSKFNLNSTGELVSANDNELSKNFFINS